MITVNQARHLLHSESAPLSTTSLPLDAASSYILAADALAAVDSPNFNNSAVDGYAFCYDTLSSAAPRVAGEISAGENFEGRFLAESEVLRIFTGAKVPDSCDTVVMQEKVQRNGSTAKFDASALKKGANVRLRGEQITQAAIALPKGASLSPASLGYLASLGVETVDVFRKPRVACLVTGNELRPLGEMLSCGEIYESNGILLASYLNQMTIKNTYSWVADTLVQLKEAIASRLEENDVILISGGVSVGDYDFTRQAIEENGFKIVFHGIKQKPGKPFLFAKKGEKYICGLPGNPRSVSACFLAYVYPLLKRLSGAGTDVMPTLQMPLKEEFARKDDGKTHFLNGVLVDGEIVISGFQQSHMLASSARANVLVELPPELMALPAGTLVKSVLLPYA